MKTHPSQTKRDEPENILCLGFILHKSGDFSDESL